MYAATGLAVSNVQPRYLQHHDVGSMLEISAYTARKLSERSEENVHSPACHRRLRIRRRLLSLRVLTVLLGHVLCVRLRSLESRVIRSDAFPDAVNHLAAHQESAARLAYTLVARRVLVGEE